MTTGGSTIQAPYLVTSRTYPEDDSQLRAVLTKSYIEIAQCVNKRTIGIYNKFQIVTGNQYFSDANFNIQDPIQFRQSYRQVYELAALPNTGTATIPTNITNIASATWVNIYGTVQSTTFATALTPWNMTMGEDAPYLRINLTTGNIEIITTTANWVTYSAIVVLEYLLT
jgi:hypothetical protein